MTDSPRALDSEQERRAMYGAACSNDTRFDGRVFIAVVTTGIYCRPVCTVKMPKFENCLFYAHAAQAEKRGFRPCLLCRPELAPGDARVEAGSTFARLALRRIEDGALDAHGVADLAREFGVDARHLRRTVSQEFGVSPREFAQTQRLLNAKQLLTESEMSVTDVAFAAGFASVRRFNTLFKSRYHFVPGSLRRRLTAPGTPQTTGDTGNPCVFRLDYRPPLNWDSLLGFLGARAIPGVETVIDGTYARTVGIDRHTGWLAVSLYPRARAGHARNALRLTLSDSLRPVCVTVMNKIKTVFDTRANAAAIDTHLASDPLLAQAIAAHGGMRLPGAFDGFELLLRAILGQQVSVKGATTLAGRMAIAFGDPITTPWPMLTHLSPNLERVAAASTAQIARIGMPGKRAETIRLVARALVERRLVLAPGADPDIVRERLIALPGIGEWTASYVAMRALAWPDAFPLGDLGIKKALGMTAARDIIERSRAWRPWRAYAAIYLWLS